MGWRSLKERTIFRVNVGRTTVKPMGTLMRSCVEVRELIKLSSDVVSGVGRGMGVLDESTCLKVKGRF